MRRCEARLSFSLDASRGQYVPLSQVGLQRVEDAELLLGLKHQQLLQHFARVGPPARWPVIRNNNKILSKRHKRIKTLYV